MNENDTSRTLGEKRKRLSELEQKMGHPSNGGFSEGGGEHEH
jgi:hypothetical protein